MLFKKLHNKNILDLDGISILILNYNYTALKIPSSSHIPSHFIQRHNGTVPGITHFNIPLDK